MTFKLGSTNINQIFLGSTEIKKAYLGSTLIHDKTGGGTPTTAFTTAGGTGAYANPSTASFAAPTVGSLLLCTMGSRTGTGHTGHAVTDANGGTWTKIFGQDQELLDSGSRHACSVWWRVATATDASGAFNVTADTGAAETTYHAVYEVIPNGDYTWALEGFAAANSGAGFWPNTNSGNTSNIAASNVCVIGIGQCRHSSPVPTSITFDGILDGNLTYITGSTNQMSSGLSVIGTPQAGGIKSTFNSNDGGGTKGVTAVLVFSG